MAGRKIRKNREKREGKTVAENVKPTRSSAAVITWQTKQL
jgi:hypothetical protein